MGKGTGVTKVKDCSFGDNAVWSEAMGDTVGGDVVGRDGAWMEWVEMWSLRVLTVSRRTSEDKVFATTFWRLGRICWLLAGDLEESSDEDR